MEIYPFCPLPREINVTALVSAFRVQRENDFYFSGEQHDFYELVYVVCGKAGVTAGEGIYVLEQGQCILYPPMEFHRLWSEDATSPELIILSFRAEQMPESLAGKYCMSPSQQVMIEDWMDENSKAFTHDDILVTGISDRAAARRQLCRLELLLAELSGSDPAPDRSYSGNAGAYTEIVRMMKEHLGETITIEQLASLCHMSKSNLKRIFFKYSGMGVISYFNQMKINRACELLIRGEAVGSVAEALGFSDQNYFSTVFRRITGMSPSSYAKQGK